MAEHPLPVTQQLFVAHGVVVAVEGHFHPPEAVRFQRLAALVDVRMRKAEHAARIPVSGQHGQPAIPLMLFLVRGGPCGGKRRLAGFPPPEFYDVKQDAHQRT